MKGRQITKPIEMKAAIAKAVDHLRSAFETEGPIDIRLEELEHVEEAPAHWLVTLSFRRDPHGMIRAMNPDWDPTRGDLGHGPRAYKTVRIRAKDGKPVAVRDTLLRETTTG